MERKKHSSNSRRAGTDGRLCMDGWHGKARSFGLSLLDRHRRAILQEPNQVRRGQSTSIGLGHGNIQAGNYMCAAKEGYPCQ